MAQRVEGHACARAVRLCAASWAGARVDTRSTGGDASAMGRPRTGAPGDRYRGPRRAWRDRTRNGRRGAPRAALGGIPSYEASFRSFSTRAVLDKPLDSDASVAARQILDAIRGGRIFTVIDAIATPGFIDLRGSQGAGSPSAMGSTLPPGPSVIAVDVSMPAGAEMILVGSGTEFRRTPDGHSVTEIESARGGYRVEVRVPRAPGLPPVPWLVTNPIYFLPPPAAPVAARAEGEVIPLPADMAWQVEKDPESRATLTASGGQVTFDYTLRTGDRASQFAALVCEPADARAAVLAYLPDRLLGASGPPVDPTAISAGWGRAVANIRLRRFNAARGLRRDRRHAAGRSAVGEYSGSSRRPPRRTACSFVRRRDR